MDISHLYGWSQYGFSNGGRRRRCRARRALVVALLAGLVLNATALAQVRATINRENPAKRNGELTEPNRDGEATDSRHVSQSSAGEIDPPMPDEQEKAERPQQPPAKADSANKGNDQGQKKEKRGEWLLAPIPISSPAIGSGLEWAVAYIFPFSKEDKTSPPSIVGVGGLFTNNGSRAVGIAGKLYLKEDKYRVTVAGGRGSINADLYGVGKLAGDKGVSLSLNGNGSGFSAESLFRLKKGIYLGPRFQYRNLTLSIDREKANIPDIDTNPPEEIKDIIDAVGDDLFRQTTVAIGLRFDWDTRDNTFYPRRGFFLYSGIDFFPEAIGSKFTYQYSKVAFNKYMSLNKHQVFAFRAMGCASTGEHVPIYDLCLFGSSNDLRGYSAGRYQDRRMFATQGEYRLTIPKPGILGRFGLVGFGGVGGVASKFTDLGFSDLLPAGGGGIRFRLTKKNPINFRVDYGIGKVGHTLSIGVGEAF
jgi:hypothetical protein